MSSLHFYGEIVDQQVELLSAATGVSTDLVLEYEETRKKLEEAEQVRFFYKTLEFDKVAKENRNKNFKKTGDFYVLTVQKTVQIFGNLKRLYAYVKRFVSNI